MHKPSLNVFQGIIYRPVLHLHAILVFCIVKSLSHIEDTAKSSYVLFLLQYCKATATVNPCTGL